MRYHAWFTQSLFSKLSAIYRHPGVYRSLVVLIFQKKYRNTHLRIQHKLYGRQKLSLDRCFKFGVLFLFFEAILHLHSVESGAKLPFWTERLLLMIAYSSVFVIDFRCRLKIAIIFFSRDLEY